MVVPLKKVAGALFLLGGVGSSLDPVRSPLQTPADRVFSLAKRFPFIVTRAIHQTMLFSLFLPPL